MIDVLTLFWYSKTTRKWGFFMSQKRKKVILVCSECLSRNYSTFKNHSSVQERLEINKFCKKCGKHTLHKESR